MEFFQTFMEVSQTSEEFTYLCGGYTYLWDCRNADIRGDCRPTQRYYRPSQNIVEVQTFKKVADLCAGLQVHSFTELAILEKVAPLRRF